MPAPGASSQPAQQRLELEDRRRRPPDDRPQEALVSVSPLVMERWAIVLRRHRAGYVGYEEIDPRALELARQSRRPDTSMLRELLSRVRSLRRGGGAGGPTSPQSA